VSRARAVVIVNPLSGRGRHEADIRSHSELANDILSAHGIDAVVRTTTAGGDARRFAQEAADAGVDLVIAWGGDGTVNEAACALVYRKIPLGIVPAGSGNGLASDLSLPTSPAFALEIAASGRTFTMDAGRVNDSVFFNIAGVGVDAAIAARFAERGLRQRGPLGYLQIGVTELLRYQTEHYQICIENETVEHDAMMLVVANGRQYGNRVWIAPGARLDDGLLELVIVSHHSLVEIAARLPSLFLGRLRAGRGIEMRTVRELHVRARNPIPFHVDGEPHLGPAELAIRIIPAALLVRVPR
jgi:YegS/Rv2252/BmrU family lipid kinase